MSKTDLWRQLRETKSEEVRQQLVISYLWLVKHLAGRLVVRFPTCMSKEDLESCGILGLLEAVDKYDPESGHDFEIYAYTRIRGAMLDELRRINWIPRTIWQKLQVLRTVRERLECRFGETVPDEVVAQEMGVSLSELYQLNAHSQRIFTVSLDEMVACAGGESVRVGELVSDETSPDPLEMLAEEDNHFLLAKAIESLNERDKLILSLYYQEELTLKEIGKVLGVSESRVCQLHNRALNRLRRRLEELMAD